MQITGATPRGRSRPARVLYLADDRTQASLDGVWPVQGRGHTGRKAGEDVFEKMSQARGRPGAGTMRTKNPQEALSGVDRSAVAGSQLKRRERTTLSDLT